MNSEDVVLSHDDINQIESESSVVDYYRLMKPTIILLVAVSFVAGFLIAPVDFNFITFFSSFIPVVFGSGAAGALNMWYDSDIDSIMSRTQKRPIPSGKINKQSAFEFGIITALISVTFIGIAVNILSAMLLAFAIFFYSYIYTVLLKRNSIYNIEIGGLAGAIPPLIGWTASMNSLSIEPFIILLIIFLWTPPHSWPLFMHLKNDYIKLGIPMTPIVKGEVYTKRLIIIYTILLITTSLLPFFLGFADILYFIPCIAVNLILLYKTFLFHYNKIKPIKLFLTSILYLFSIFGFLILDRIAFKLMT